MRDTQNHLGDRERIYQTGDYFLRTLLDTEGNVYSIVVQKNQKGNFDAFVLTPSESGTTLKVNPDGSRTPFSSEIFATMYNAFRTIFPSA